jgi:Restriction endonuclease
MSNYSFEELLSPLDFEHLVRDLLSRDLGIELTAFAEGKDKGTDLRYAKEAGSNIIVQCKRVKSIGKKGLIKEADKIKKLNPNKYYFVVSSDISVTKFDQIKEIFREWMSGDDNIYSKNRLNNLIDSYQDIHRKHYKLWLNSARIFNSLINQPLYERAKALISTIKKDYKYYVKNESLNKAIDILNDHHFLIISGIPGIGKTTLARLILWEYLLLEYEIIEIRKIIEGEQILEEDSLTKQVFYFDDFLGENFLKYDVIEGRSNDVVQFIKRIMNNKNKVLIMTTREYILNQAKDRYEKLNTEEFDIYKYTLDLESYSNRIKALILYNHLFYSGVSFAHIKDIISSKAYKTIINHKNYSPRIIEQMTVFLKAVVPQEYSKYFIENLDYPFGIWDKAFKSQISESSRIFLFVLLSIGESILVEEFKETIAFIFQNSTLTNALNFKYFDLKINLKELEDCFIKIDITTKRNYYINFQNPSIRDFVLNIVKNDKDIILVLLKNAYYFNQLIYIVNYLIDNFKTDTDINAIIKRRIIEGFVSFKYSSWISSSGTQYTITYETIGKISSLVPYLKQLEDDELIMFIINNFNQVDVNELDYYQERKYIEFVRIFRNKMKIEFNDLLNKVFKKIDIFENIKNFFSLKQIDNDLFSSYIDTNEQKLEEKIYDTLDKEIENSDNKQYLENLKFDISDNRDSIEMLENLDLSYFDRAIDIKIRDIQSSEDSLTKGDDIEVEEYEEEKGFENYNGDDLFKEALFI